ncbi:hypothetical protein GQ457_09G024940 [Hibiscus cannabinus]
MAPPEVEFDDESVGETQVFSNKRINVCLTRSNYLLWKQQVVLTNRGLGLEGYLDGSVVAPAKLVRNRAGAQSMQDYTMNIKETCDLLAACGSLVSELEHIAMILNGLPIEYEPSIAAITASKDTYSVDNVVSILIDAETRLEDSSRFPVRINYTRYNAMQVVTDVGAEASVQEASRDASKLGFQSLPVLVHPSGADFTTVAEGGTDSLLVGQNASETVASVQERASLSTPQPSHDSEGFEVPSAATTGADHTESPQGSAFQQANSPEADFQRADSQGAGFQRDDSQRTVVQDAESFERVIDKTQSVRGRSCMSAVCRSWQASLVDQKLKFPACLLLAEKEDSDERCLYNVSEEILVELDLPEIRGRRCWGSPFGWLETCGLDLEIQLFNPLSRASLPLPSLRAFPGYEDEEWEDRTPKDLCSFFLRKLILTSSPEESGSDCIVLAIYRYLNLAFAKPGDKAWTRIDNVNGVADAIYFKGNFYFCTWDGDIFLCEDLFGPCPKATKFAPPPPAQGPPEKYLFDLRGNLCLASREAQPQGEYGDDDDEDEDDNGDGDGDGDEDEDDDDGDGDDNGDEDDNGDDDDEDEDKDDDGDEYSEKTIGFEIFKLDMQARCWEKMFSLGDSSLFLGNCCTFVIAAADYPGCRPNCIYLAEDEAVYFQHTGGVDMGIYDCENLKLDIDEVILPKGVIRDIEKLCMRFFWKGKDEPAKGARVGWKVICSPKSEGGLGVRNLDTWNKACLIQLIRKLLSAEGSLWVTWIRCYVFKDLNYWTVSCRPWFSWCVRKLLTLRPVAQALFADGPVGMMHIWNGIRDVKPKVPWHKIVWYGLHVPKHALILWMAILNRLPTLDRLRRMGLNVDIRCVLCGGGHEDRNHIFTECSYSTHIWTSILHSCDFERAPLGWDEELQWLCSNLKGKSLRVTLLKLAWASFVYHIWVERNRRTFRGISRDCNSLLFCIKEEVLICVQHRNIRIDGVNRQLGIAWGML